MVDFIKNNKFVITALAIAVVTVGIFVMTGTGDTQASGNAKVDNSREVKTNVGDTELAAGAMQLDGISVGGNIGQIGSNTKTLTNNAEKINQGN